jgi:hypothetical protein
MLGGYSECVKTNPQPVEPAKVGALTQRIRDQQNAPDDGSVPFVVRCPSLDVEPAKVGLSECEVANCPEPAPDHAGGRHYCAQHLANVNAGRRPDVDEPAKVVSVISLSDRPQSVEPAKVEPPKRLALVRDAESGSWDEAVQSGPHAVDYVLASIHDATQTALAAANAADEAHRKGCDIAMAALVQAEAENRCDVCAGEPLASGMTCMCGGTGKMSEAVSVVRKAWADALVERDVVLNLLIEYGGDRIDVWQQERRRLLAEYDAKKGGPK